MRIYEGPDVSSYSNGNKHKKESNFLYTPVGKNKTLLFLIKGKLGSKGTALGEKTN